MGIPPAPPSPWAEIDAFDPDAPEFGFEPVDRVCNHHVRGLGALEDQPSIEVPFFTVDTDGDTEDSIDLCAACWDNVDLTSGDIWDESVVEHVANVDSDAFSCCACRSTSTGSLHVYDPHGNRFLLCEGCHDDPRAFVRAVRAAAIRVGPTVRQTGASGTLFDFAPAGPRRAPSGAQAAIEEHATLNWLPSLSRVMRRVGTFETYGSVRNWAVIDYECDDAAGREIVTVIDCADGPGNGRVAALELSRRGTSLMLIARSYAEYEAEYLSETPPAAES